MKDEMARFKKVTHSKQEVQDCKAFSLREKDKELNEDEKGTVYSCSFSTDYYVRIACKDRIRQFCLRLLFQTERKPLEGNRGFA